MLLTNMKSFIALSTLFALIILVFAQTVTAADCQPTTDTYTTDSAAADGVSIIIIFFTF